MEPRKGDLCHSLFRIEGLGLWRERVIALAYYILEENLYKEPMVSFSYCTSHSLIMDLHRGIHVHVYLTKHQ
jgi:hypothetical protein